MSGKLTYMWVCPLWREFTGSWIKKKKSKQLNNNSSQFQLRVCWTKHTLFDSGYRQNPQITSGLFAKKTVIMESLQMALVTKGWRMDGWCQINVIVFSTCAVPWYIKAEAFALLSLWPVNCIFFPLAFIGEMNQRHGHDERWCVNHYSPPLWCMNPALLITAPLIKKYIVTFTSKTSQINQPLNCWKVQK